MICNFMIFSESVGSGASLSADKEGASNDAPSFFRHRSYFPLRKGLGDVAAISYAITLNIHVGLTSPCPPL